MNSPIDRPWLVQLRCPFCDTLVIEDADLSLLPEDMPDEEREEISCSSGESPFVGQCEHLAFQSDWAYAGPEILMKTEMKRLGKAISDEEQARDAGIAEDEMAKLIDRARCDDEVDGELLHRLFPEHDAAFITKYVEKYDGVQSGGPDYGLIFLRRKIVATK